MNENQNLIKAYLKFRDSIPPINEEEKKLILTSKDELNRCFNKEHLKAIDIINASLNKIGRLKCNDGLSDYYLNSIYRDLLYFSFSTSGYSVSEHQMDNVSKCKVSQLTTMLNSLKKIIVSKENATDIIDVIVDEFSKLKK